MLDIGFILTLLPLNSMLSCFRYQLRFGCLGNKMLPLVETPSFYSSAPMETLPGSAMGRPVCASDSTRLHGNQSSRLN
ncbi:hypothetical protein GGS20DRAFT_558961 [Poronia punctata]|nr:hypothetical protein GGS20DRAFT_558961 [Poronia punctata]